MGPIWGRQDAGGHHVGPMNFAIWVALHCRNAALMTIAGLEIVVRRLVGAKSFTEIWELS